MQFPPFVPELYGLGEKLLFQFKKDDVERIRYEKSEKKETKDKPKEEIEIRHRVLVQMEGTAHIDFSRFETTEAINFKILSVMHMQKL